MKTEITKDEERQDKNDTQINEKWQDILQNIRDIQDLSRMDIPPLQ